MGHVSEDSYLGPGGAVAAAGGAGMEENSSAGPRQLAAVRRGAVRERTPGQKVVPSDWEHLEMDLDQGPDHLSSLSLEVGGTFRATLAEQRRDGDSSCVLEALVLASASGTWQQCRGGVELDFAEAPELDLPEFQVTYTLRRGCLVAGSTELPDGLAQEYSRCPEMAAPQLGAERLALIDRMLADAAEAPAPVEGESSPVSSPSRSPTAVAPEPTLSPQHPNADLPTRTLIDRMLAVAPEPTLRPQHPNADSDSDDIRAGIAPVVIADGSDSDDDDDDSSLTGGINPRCVGQTLGYSAPSPPVAPSHPVAGVKGNAPPADQVGVEEEEYNDDFDNDSEDAESNGGDKHTEAKPSVADL